MSRERRQTSREKCGATFQNRKKTATFICAPLSSTACFIASWNSFGRNAMSLGPADMRPWGRGCDSEPNARPNDKNRQKKGSSLACNFHADNRLAHHFMNCTRLKQLQRRNMPAFAFPIFAHHNPNLVCR